ncbi:TcmI family type II polyketide cyclase [Kitasatospora viridis]|uniref:Cyclase n=1 Tax=Kitasatospora viridis TaxID=281105 RepID=A0A561UCG9_9ACTN|nr:TcmI family type II polyketide cyclase [Kitasatospora viridis]TWF97058.1 cyclase [Kitasatospora viridis]
MHRSLIIAKIAPGAEQQVAEIFAESDRGDLPTVAHVQRRSLYRLGDLYVHLIESDAPSPEVIAAARSHPEFALLSERLDPFISPYLPTWRSPQDAIAARFYDWSRTPDQA